MHHATTRPVIARNVVGQQPVSSQRRSSTFGRFHHKTMVSSTTGSVGTRTTTISPQAGVYPPNRPPLSNDPPVTKARLGSRQAKNVSKAKTVTVLKPSQPRVVMNPRLLNPNSMPFCPAQPHPTTTNNFQSFGPPSLNHSVPKANSTNNLARTPIPQQTRILHQADLNTADACDKMSEVSKDSVDAKTDTSTDSHAEDLAWPNTNNGVTDFVPGRTQHPAAHNLTKKPVEVGRPPVPQPKPTAEFRAFEPNRSHTSHTSHTHPADLKPRSRSPPLKPARPAPRPRAYTVKPSPRAYTPRQPAQSRTMSLIKHNARQADILKQQLGKTDDADLRGYSGLSWKSAHARAIYKSAAPHLQQKTLHFGPPRQAQHTRVQAFAYQPSVIGPLQMSTGLQLGPQLFQARPLQQAVPQRQAYLPNGQMVY